MGLDFIISQHYSINRVSMLIIILSNHNINYCAYIYLPIMGTLTFQIVKRGTMPGGGGEVIFKCPVRRNIRPINFVQQGKIKRIRGTAYLFPLSAWQFILCIIMIQLQMVAWNERVILSKLILRLYLVSIKTMLVWMYLEILALIVNRYIHLN